MGKGISEETKSAVLFILYKDTFNPIDLIGYLEVFSKIGMFLRGDCGKDFIMEYSSI